MKICSKCKVEKSLSEFSNNSKHRDRKAYSCKLCVKLAAIPHKERNSEYNKALYRSNRDSVIERTRMYSKANPEVAKKAELKYREANSEKILLKTSLRRATKLNAAPKWINSEWEKLVLSEIYKLSKMRSTMTGVKHHVDHKVPLKSDSVCGLHCSDNLQILEWHINVRKSNRYWENMP